MTCVSDSSHSTRMECISDPRFKISILWYMLTDSQCGLVGEARRVGICSEQYHILMSSAG